MADLLIDRVRHAVGSLTPGYFALVMGNGIISVGLRLQHHDLLSAVLLGVCAVSYVLLVALSGWRLASFRANVLDRVAMGACAITVLTGAQIVEMADAPMVAATRGLIAGAAVGFWAFATWLIPALVVAGWWRHRIHRVPLAYEATLWSIVFPLGMYAVAGIYLGEADALPVVKAIGAAELWVALTVFALVGAAMLRHLWLSVFAAPAPAAAPAHETERNIRDIS
ncbi:MAG TPA: hypothetical protein VFX33_09780 [Actinomycetales bacterium]|nr:hypothetical protein [Actinomycetales bacterium]